MNIARPNDFLKSGTIRRVEVSTLIMRHLLIALLLVGAGLAQNVTKPPICFPPLDPTANPRRKEPPFAGMGIQDLWSYSDLVCAGTAEKPVETGIVETLGGEDRDQLATWVVLETCFKGKAPAAQIEVQGDDVLARKQTSKGFVYAGPPTGFVTKGRNLLFLRKTDDSRIWRVTVPVYATCIPLASIAPQYELINSDDSIRRALVAEFKAAIEQGEIDTDRIQLADADAVAAMYLPYILQVLGRADAMREFKLLMSRSSGSLRQEFAMALLRQGDPAGEPDTIARLQDATAVTWKRANAAYALADASSDSAREALQKAANQLGPEELRRAAQESLSRMGR